MRHDWNPRPWWVVILGVLAVFSIPDRNATLMAALVAAVLFAFRHARLRGLVPLALSDDASPRSPEGSRTWTAAGALVVLLGLGIAEAIQPAYFAQDDNLAQFLPVMDWGCRSLLSGTFPDWNPYQFLGSPAAGLGTYALTYPPTWLSGWIARGLLGRPGLLLDVFAFLHLLGGYFAMARLVRRLGGARPLAAAAGACWALCGFFLVGGRSWYYMLPTALWAPLLVHAAVAWRDGETGPAWIAGTGAVIGAYFHSGNAQMWTYAMLFFVLALALFARERFASAREEGRGWRSESPHVLAVFAALLLGAAVAMPLLLVQARETEGVIRRHLGQGILPGLHATILPWPLARAHHPHGWGTIHSERMGTFYYSGTFFLAAALPGMFAVAACRWPRAGTRGLPVLLSMLLLAAFLLALGPAARLWDLQGSLPLLDKFAVPFKYLAFLVLFACAAGALVLDRALAARGGARAAIAVAAFALMLWNAANALPSFYSYAFRPYPTLPDSLRPLLDASTGKRVWACGPDRSRAADFPFSLRAQFPTFYGSLGFEGYDPLVSKSPETLKAMEAVFVDPVAGMLLWGVGRVVLFHPGALEAPGSNPVNHALEVRSPLTLSFLRRVEGATRPLASAPGVEVRDLPLVSPLAMVRVDGKDRPLPLTFDGSGMRVDLADSPGGTVIVAFLHRPAMSGAVDGRPVKVVPDPYGRITVEVPAGSRTLDIVYRPPWSLGFALGAALLAVSLALSRLARSFALGRSVSDNASR